MNIQSERSPGRQRRVKTQEVRGACPALLSKSLVEVSSFHPVTCHSAQEPCRLVPSDKTWELLIIIRLTAPIDPWQGCDWATSTEQGRPIQWRHGSGRAPGAVTVVSSGNGKRANMASPFGLIDQVNCHWIKSYSDGRRGNSSGKSTKPGVRFCGQWAQMMMAKVRKTKTLGLGILAPS